MEAKPKRQHGVSLPLIIGLSVLAILVLAWIANPTDMQAVWGGLQGAMRASH